MKKIVFFLLCIVLLSPKSVFAQTKTENPAPLPLQMLQITPIISDLTLIPGQQSVIEYQIHNLSDAPLGIHATLSSPVAFSNSSAQNLFTSPLLSWSHIDTPNILLGPKQNSIITLRIFPPQKTANRGYAETVFFTPIVDYQQAAKQPVIVSRIGALILATVGTLDYTHLESKVLISSFRPSSYISNTSPIHLTFSIDNSYFTFFTAKPFLTITPFFGHAKTITLTEHHVLPGISREWQENYVPLPWNIFYTADLAVSLGQGKQLHARTFFLFIPQWFLFACAFLFLFICLFFLWKILKNPKRLKKSVAILLKGES